MALIFAFYMQHKRSYKHITAFCIRLDFQNTDITTSRRSTIQKPEKIQQKQSFITILVHNRFNVCLFVLDFE